VISICLGILYSGSSDNVRSDFMPLSDDR